MVARVWARAVDHIKSRRRSIIAFLLVGGGTFALGVFLLRLFVETFHIEKNLAFILQMLICLQFNFNLNDRITWGDRRGQGKPYWKRWFEYHLTRFGMIVLSMVIFAVCVFWGIEYMFAFTIDAILGTGINYAVGERVVFTENTDKPNGQG